MGSIEGLGSGVGLVRVWSVGVVASSWAEGVAAWSVWTYC